MKYKVEFQYKAPDRDRPNDEVQEIKLLFERGEFLPIPNVGDSVSYEVDRKIQYFKVLTRHFDYMQAGEDDWCMVNIVVTDMPEKEMAARLKE